MSMFRDKLKICEAAALIALCMALCAGTCAEGRQEALSGKLVRLHVLAHSDDAAEQQIKLRVRDAVLGYLQKNNIEKDFMKIISLAPEVL